MHYSIINYSHYTVHYNPRTYFVTGRFFLFVLAAWGLHCCVWAFSGCGEGGYSLLRCAGFSLQWLLLWSTGSRSTGFSSCGTQAQQLWHTDLVAPRHVGSSRARAQTHVPCIGRWILNHCATREAHNWKFLPFDLLHPFLQCPPLPSPLAIIKLFSVSMRSIWGIFYLFQVPHISENIQYLSFSV